MEQFLIDPPDGLPERHRRVQPARKLAVPDLIEIDIGRFAQRAVPRGAGGGE
jgi:hypothetical protein